MIIDGTVCYTFDWSLIKQNRQPCQLKELFHFDVSTSLDEISFGYLVKCRHSELDKARVKYKLDMSR